MPKSAKKRKDKAADFSKAKFKLGKGKQPASNAIDTSIKTRSIALPTQRLANDTAASQPTTRRRLTFNDLVSQLKHYNSGTRKDAILGLKELLEGHWYLLDSCLTTLVHATVRLIGDEDAGVRRVLLSFYGWLVPQIKVEDLAPHTSVILLFTTSAQTHIFPEIRIDAVRFLDIYLEHIPLTVVRGWNDDRGDGRRVLEAYMGILNAGTKFGQTDESMKVTSTASVSLSPSSKLTVIRSLATFLEVAISPSAGFTEHGASSSTDFDGWFFESSFANPAAYVAFERLLRPSLQNALSFRWQEQVVPEDKLDNFPQCYSEDAFTEKHLWTLQDLQAVGDDNGRVSSSNIIPDSDTKFLLHLSRIVHSTLVSTFLDHAPAIFSPTIAPQETDVELVLSVARIARCLYCAVLQSNQPSDKLSSTDITDFRSLLGYMARYFPYRLHGNGSSKIDGALQELNLIYCTLISLLATITDQTDTMNSTVATTKKRTAATNTKSVVALQAERVYEHVIGLLRGDGAGQIPQSMAPAAYITLLPVMWALINTPAQSQPIFNAVLDHGVKTASKSNVKGLSIAFISRLVLLDNERQYTGAFRPGHRAGDAAKLQDWLLHLPQTLWEIGTKNLAVSETILRTLLRVVQRRSKALHGQVMSSLRSRLVPYFCVNHSVRGKLPGPFCNLQSGTAVRRLALDVVATLSIADHAQDTEVLLAVVDGAVLGTMEQAYWTHVKSTLLRC